VIKPAGLQFPQILSLPTSAIVECDGNLGRHGVTDTSISRPWLRVCTFAGAAPVSRKETHHACRHRKILQY
jgi:hypothetical protein